MLNLNPSPIPNPNPNPSPNPDPDPNPDPNPNPTQVSPGGRRLSSPSGPGSEGFLASPFRWRALGVGLGLWLGCIPTLKPRTPTLQRRTT